MSAPDPNTPPATDLVNSSYIRPLLHLLSSMDRDIATLYAEAGLTDFRPRFTGPLIQLGRRGELTIRDLADAAEVTHSAMSQTVAAMRKHGLVESVPGGDARMHRVRLTDKSLSMVRFMEAEWRSTEQTLLDLETEVPYPLAQAVRDLERALADKPFSTRLRETLTANLENEDETES